MPPLKKPVSGGSVPPAPPPAYLSSSDTFAYPVPALDGGNPNDPQQAISVAFLPAETVPAGRQGEWIPPGPPPQPAYVPEASASYQYTPAPATSAGTASSTPPYPSSSDSYGSYVPALDGGNPSDPDTWVSTAFLPPESVPAGREGEWFPPMLPPGGAGYLGVSLTPAQTNTPTRIPLASMVAADVRWAPQFAPPRTAPYVTPPRPSVNTPAASSGAVSGTGGNPYASALNGGRQAGGQGYAPWPGAGLSEGDTAFPLGFADDWGDDADPFAAMRDNPIFARYFAVLERRYGREGAMRRMRGLSRRFRFGRRIARAMRSPFGSGPHLRTTER